VPSGATTAATISANPTISASFTVGSLTDATGVQYTINNGGNLQVGNSSNSANMTFNTNGQIKINTGGTLEIWGNLVVNANLQLDVTGTLIIHGNLTMGTGAQISAQGSGDITVNGNLTGGNNTQIQIQGSGSTLTVGGAITLTGGQGSITSSSGGVIKAASCSCAGCGGGSGNVLPVTLLFFNGSVAFEKIELKWATGSELNFDHFNLEKSVNGKNFLVLKEIKGHGTTNERQDYQAIDENPAIGFNYYRLTSVDFDNYQETFKTIAVQYLGERKLILSPNPFNGSEIKLNSNFDLTSSGTLSVFDSMGVLVSEFSVLESSTSIHFSNPLRSGVYIAKFNSSSFTSVMRLVVQ
jgi:hypothetical protein